MSDPQQRLVPFDGLGFPVWVVVDEAVEAGAGESFATHYLTSEAVERDMPLFSTEANARAYIESRGLAGHRPAPIHDIDDLILRLELFRNRGGHYVRIDDVRGPTAGHPCFDLGDFIRYARGH